MLIGGNLRSFPRALTAQFALAVALMQIAEGVLQLRGRDGLPDAVIRAELRAVLGQGELRIGAQEGGGFRGLHLVQSERIGVKDGIGSLEPLLHLLPGEGLL